MKHKWIVPIFISTLVLAACGANDRRVAENDHLYHKSGNSIDVAEHGDIYNDNRNQANNDLFGFVRQVKSPVPGETIDTKPIRINREQTANNISKMAVNLPNVQDASVLVTDQEVLVAYLINNTDEKVRFETADQVKKIAISAVPRWFHIYVTDDPALRQNVENIASMNARSTNKDKTVRDTVNLMLERSPQGRHLNKGENANGETIGGMNNDLERTNYREQLENTGR
ncbi:YhcN/YlaJ family sporulation lipoprotein [Lederbergia citrea]|uniref:YhcN/YlaJ family sporulation lipoprotein n=1 Tax=Lederbergia citrea TaxID=2833581 RepID=A0A942Z4Z1_9BACI|nr:YhcN/YlaJ family sporulation lipoprotein [Lederbergia citrea]MBS4222900.1 YhcN/YlaJ family sporulation lipoprotein [Lederbergia citrea]